MMFPLGLSAPTTLYMVLYIATLIVHVAFMNYTLAGAVVLGVETAQGRARQPLATTLRDWLTVALSMAITAGVAPLLFVQLLYREGFYTANLLLGPRWMAVIPALIIGFYLLYLGKTERVGARKGWAVFVSLAAVACFVFVGYSFTENHLLSIAPSDWAGFYGSGKLAYIVPAAAPRYAMFFLGAFPTLAIGLGWQLLGRGTTHRSVAHLGIGGLIASAVMLGLWIETLPEAASSAVLGPAGGPWLGVATLGGLTQFGAWAFALRRGLSRGPLVVGTFGLAATLLGMSCVREVVRLSAVDIGALAEQHAYSAQSGGLLLFVLFLAINGALIVWAIAQARKAAPPAT
jgi:hypothetical protein